MINVTTLADGSIASISAALIEIGFVSITAGDTELRWEKDTNEKVKVKLVTYGQNTQIYLAYSNGTNFSTVFQSLSAVSWNLTYELIGDSILFGLAPSSQSNRFDWGIIAPETSDDDWLYIFYQTPSVVNGNSENIIANSTLYVNGTNGVALVKVWNGNKFADNLYMAVYSPTLNPASGTNDINYATVEVNGDYYRLVNLTNGSGYLKYAIKLPSVE